MSFEPMYRDLERVARHLPFPLNDIAAANEAFGKWRREGCDHAKREVDVWTYCYVRRYLLVKFAADQSAPLADFEMLVDRVYRKIDRKRTSVAESDRYAAWVSVVCRNTYFNYLRSVRILIPMERDEEDIAVEEPENPGLDEGMVLDAVHASIEYLPPYLREVAQLRLIEDLSYEEVSRRTGLDASILRAYVCKIVKRLRRDRRLARLLGEPVKGDSAGKGYE